MLVKDVIIKACDFIDNAELSDALKNNITLSSDLQETLNKLVKCFNFVRNEIASEYIPIVKVDKVMPIQNKIDLNNLSCAMLDIVSVKDMYDNNLKFELRDDVIYVKSDREVYVQYNCISNELSIVDEFSSRLPERVYAYGIVKEYYFMQTLYEDAKIWDERFKNSLQVIERKKSETIIPRRRWI